MSLWILEQPASNPSGFLSPCSVLPLQDWDSAVFCLSSGVGWLTHFSGAQWGNLNHWMPGVWPATIKHVLLLWYFDIWDLADPGETGPPRVSQFLDTVKNPLGETPHTQTNQSRAHTTPQISSIGFSPQLLSPYSSHTRTRSWTTREASMPQTLPKVLKRANPRLLTHLMHFPLGNHNGHVLPTFPPSSHVSWLTLVQLCVALSGRVCMSPASRSYEYKHFFFIFMTVIWE